MPIMLAHRIAPRTLAAALFLMLAAVAPSMAAPSVSQPPSYGSIVSQSYDAYQQITETHLANGLTILSKETHGAPVVYFSVWYKVGSRNEITGQTGLSHILEHMMFKGTHDLPPGSINHLFVTNGGEINANTGTDRTEYFELIASDRLELAIRVEADRMENSAFDPTELKHEMVVVRSELEGDSNDPNYQLYSFSYLPTAFISHPYHWPTLGWRSDVEAVASRRNVIYQYYKQHYMPNNAIVVMVGDIDTKRAVQLCQKYFGVYPPGQLEHHYITPEPEQHGERRVVLRRPGTVGEVIIGYHAPALGTKDHYVMDVISGILSGGRSARLFQDLVETGTAQDASSGNSDLKDPYLFELTATDGAGVSNDTVEKALEAEVTKLQTAPVTQDELRRALQQYDASYTYANDSVSEQADQIGEYAAVLSYKYRDTYLATIHKVTPADIQRVAKQWFTTDNRTVATFEPLPLPPGVNGTPPRVVDNFGAVKPISNPRQKAILEALDKKYNSAIAHIPSAKRPKPTRVVLPNGLTLIVEENHANQTVALQGLVRAGSMYDPTGEYGVASLTADMLGRGTTTKSALDLYLALESVGAEVGFSADTEDASVRGQCLSKDFGLTMSTMADELLHPAFPSDQVDKLRSESLSGLEQARQETGGTGGAGSLADIAFAQSMFPKGHPYWEPSIDDSETALKGITPDTLRSFYSQYYRPDTTVLVIVGDVKTADVVAEVGKLFGGWAKPATPVPSIDIPTISAPATAPAAQMIAIPQTTQTSILWGFPGELKRGNKDFYPAYIMNYILGGDTWGSRLGKTIRDQLGLAYSVYSFFDASHGAGAFSVFVGTNPANANHVTYEIRTITKAFLKSGATADEVRLAKEYLTGSYPIVLETNDGIAGRLLNSEDYGLGLDFIQRREAIINAVTVDQVNAAAHKYLHPDSATLVIAGATPGK